MAFSCISSISTQYLLKEICISMVYVVIVEGRMDKRAFSVVNRKFVRKSSTCIQSEKGHLCGYNRIGG